MGRRPILCEHKISREHPMAEFNPLVHRLSPPPIPSVLAWARAYDGARGEQINLSQAVPGYPTHPDMLKWLGEMAAQQQFTNYGDIEGEPELRKTYASHVSDVYGAQLSPANIHITSGANQAIMSVIMAIACAGESVALPLPFYFNHDTTLAMLGIRSVPVACDEGFLPDIDAVKKVAASGIRALVLVTPNNPTGAVYPPALLAEIFEICRAANIWLILDETYRDFLPAGQAPHALLDVPGWEKNLALIYSFSKSYCIPGHRLGAITAGADMVDQVAKVMDNLQICAPRSPQAAVAKAIPALADWRKSNNDEIIRRAAAMKDVMTRLPTWEISAIGAYFAYVRHPFRGAKSEAVAEKLARDYGVVCLPGAYFGEGQDNYLRFAFANADAATILKLEERLKHFSL
jgi:aspartate/methionine/tyrosine aminotransferase